MMPRRFGVLTAVGLLAASCMAAASSVEAKPSSYVADEQRAHVAKKHKSVAAKRKAAKRKAAKRKAAKRKSTAAAKQISLTLTPRTPVNKHECIEAAQSFYTHAKTRFRQQKQGLPREFERVISELNEFCGEEEFEKARVSIDWMNACMKDLGKDVCSRDKDYFCAIDARSQACLREKGEVEGKNSSSPQRESDTSP